LQSSGGFGVVPDLFRHHFQGNVGIGIALRSHFQVPRAIDDSHPATADLFFQFVAAIDDARWYFLDSEPRGSQNGGIVRRARPARNGGIRDVDRSFIAHEQ
jgi:hypothetical protein